MLVIHRVGVFSFAKFSGILYALIGLVFGLVSSATSIVAGGILLQYLSTSSTAKGSSGGILNVLVGVGACIFFPIIYGILGFIGGAIMAVIANITLKLSGGLEFKTKS